MKAKACGILMVVVLLLIVFGGVQFSLQSSRRQPQRQPIESP
jgi:hypothetical protein